MPLLSRYSPSNLAEDQYQRDKRIGKYALFISGAFLIVIWLIKLFEFEYRFDLSTWGISPLELKGLRGIAFSPLIHSNFEHLAANSIPLFMLTFSLFFFYKRAFLIFFSIYFISGVFVWLFGREALHIGASGIIYGLAAFLFLSGILSHNIRLLTISLIVAFLYGYLFWGIFPIKPEISWESHLWGGVTGFGIALLLGRDRNSVQPEETEEDDSDENQNNSLPPDDPTISA